jgi:CRP/FNR family transcriptional regulator
VIPLFQALKPAERETLRPLIRLKSYDAGEVIFREGDPGTVFHFILGGRVKVQKAAADGRDLILEIFGPGDPVGAVAAYEERNFPVGLTRRMIELTRRLAERSSRVEYRVARLFLTLAERIGRPEGEGVIVPLVLSRQEIADMVGTTQETAIRIMSRWGKDGIVQTTAAGFMIPRRAALLEIPPAD